MKPTVQCGDEATFIFIPLLLIFARYIIHVAYSRFNMSTGVQEIWHLVTKEGCLCV